MKLSVPPLLFVLFTVGLMSFVAWFFPGHGFFFPGQLSISLLLFAGGIIIAVTAVILFWQKKTTVLPTRPERASNLVTGGVYKISRNPMYLGMVLILSGFGIWLGNLTAMVIILLFILIITKFQIMPEEEVLARKFPKEFDDYRKTTRRWL